MNEFQKRALAYQVYRALRKMASFRKYAEEVEKRTSLDIAQGSNSVPKESRDNKPVSNIGNKGVKIPRAISMARNYKRGGGRKGGKGCC